MMRVIPLLRSRREEGARQIIIIKDPPSSVIARFANGHATQVGAHAEHDEPLGLLDASVVGLGIAKALPVDLARLVDLPLRAVANEHGLAAPLDDRVLALRYPRELHLDLGERQHVRRRGHRPQELGHGRLGHRGGEHAHGAYHEVGQRAVPGGRGGLVRAQVGHFGCVAARRGHVHRALVGERSACGDWEHISFFITNLRRRGGSTDQTEWAEVRCGFVSCCTGFILFCF